MKSTLIIVKPKPQQISTMKTGELVARGELFLWDFNIKEEANGTRKPIVKEANVNVTNHLLEIRLYWAGKGTTQIPARGNYGPIISAISLCHSTVKTKHHTSYPLVFGITGALLAITLLALGLYAQKRCRGDRNTRKRDPGLYGNDWNISKLRGTDTHGSSSTSGLTDQTATTTKSSVSGADLYPLYPESMILNSTVDFSSPSL
ncbi:hypothetical protein Bca52824_072923 [Brassica carinata]|uniref:Malectin domain-containing protein n=1 Tax=Brassica carinata TaxID=52824 RepID=A0A8X7U5D4_BRACI|nr:hypothetical protein Bca52824_072923 [Brassica carinata]